MTYFVWGGRFRDTAAAWSASEPSPTLLADGETMEVYGPFGDMKQAERVQLEQTRRQVDICAHRLIISERAPAAA